MYKHQFIHGGPHVYNQQNDTCIREKPCAYLELVHTRKQAEIIMRTRLGILFLLCSIFLIKVLQGIHLKAASFVLKWPVHIPDNSYPRETQKVRDEQGR